MRRGSVVLHILNLLLNEGEWSTSSSAALPPGERALLIPFGKVAAWTQS